VSSLIHLIWTIITQIATHQLIERGLLSYDTPVSQIIPEFATPVILDPGYKKPNAKLTYKFAKTPITIFHLMTHTSGVYYALRTPNPPFALADGYILPHDKEDPHQGFIRIVKVRGKQDIAFVKANNANIYRKTFRGYH
jgi:CubicO group peptidase (beta-lactamase class C family)